VRATAFDGEGRENIVGDLVKTTITSDSCHLDYKKYIYKKKEEIMLYVEGDANLFFCEITYMFII